MRSRCPISGAISTMDREGSLGKMGISRDASKRNPAEAVQFNSPCVSGRPSLTANAILVSIKPMGIRVVDREVPVGDLGTVKVRRIRGDTDRGGGGIAVG